MCRPVFLRVRHSSCLAFIVALAANTAVFENALGAPAAADPRQAAVNPPEPVSPSADAESDLPRGHSQHGEAFNEGPRQAARLIPGTGRIRFPVTSKVQQVQAFIEQGIGQVHGFWYFEAERSFRQAAKLDPDCAIAYWGMALANRNNSKRAKQFIGEAVKRKAQASKREQQYIEAYRKYVLGSGSRKKKAAQLVKDLEQIVKDHPNDLEALALLSYTLYARRGDLKRKHDDVAKVLEREPLHPVHHFRIHLWDHKDPSRALPSAAKCGAAAPAIAHMWHMPGHIYSRLKRYHDAVWQQEASARVDHAQMMRDRLLPDQIHNFAHNNEWLIRNLIYIGRWRDAADLAKNMIELPRHPRYNTLTKRGSAYYGRLRLFDVLTRFERWQDLVRLAEGEHLEPTQQEGEQIRRLRQLGVAQVELGRHDDAHATLAELARRLAATAGPAPHETRHTPLDKKESKAKSGSSATRQKLERAIAAIRSRMAAGEGRFDEALKLAKKAAEDKLLQARLQVLAGQIDEGLKTAESYMKSQTNRVQPLAAFIEILWLADRKDDARRQFEKLREISSAIQFDSPIFDRLAPVATALELPADWRVPRDRPKDFGPRPPLDSLGPFRWAPSAAPNWVLHDHQGEPHALKAYSGKPVIVIFYLGYGCLHCAEQLGAFAPRSDDFRRAGIEIVAISTDDRQGLKKSLSNYKPGMPFPLLANPQLDVFKAYRAFDDFEEQPLHGTFLVDGKGRVRWQDISYEPFMDVDFVLRESKRLLGLGQSPGADAR